MNKTKKMLLTALLLGSTVVLGRILSIRTTFITIGFSFVPIMLAAIILGTKHTIFISTISDIIGALLFPTGSYFIGFTITAFLTGLVYGLILYDKNGIKLNKKFFIKLIISTLIVSVILNGILNTFWLYILTKKATKIIAPLRIIKQFIMIPIKILTICSLVKIFETRFNEIIK